MAIKLNDSLLKKYLSWLALEKNAKPNTLYNSKLVFGRLSRWLGKKQFNLVNCRAWLVERRAAGDKNSSLATYIWLIKSLCLFLGENFGNQLPHIKVIAPPVDPLSVEEIRALINAPREYHFSAMKEFWDLLISLLARTGRRVSEVCQLKVKDIDFGRSAMLLSDPKNNTPMWFPIPKDLTNRLEKFCAKKEPEDFVFTSYKTGRHITPSAVRLELELRASLISLKKRVHPHLFRHSYPVELLSRGVPLPLVSRLLGHAQLESTMRYVHLVLEDIRQAALFHPLNQVSLPAEELVRSLRHDLEKYQKIDRPDIEFETREGKGIFELRVRW